MTLPQAPPAFRWTTESWGAALRAVPLEAHAQHLFTTRQLQLPAGSEAAWTAVADALGACPADLRRVKQVHGRTVLVVRDDSARTGERPEADALIGAVPGTVLAVQVADCVPMLMIDPRRGAAAAVHAGWRGTCAGIATATIAGLTREFGSAPSDLQVALGPSIGRCCYEVGDELLTAFRVNGAAAADVARWFSRTPEGSLRLDLWSANLDQLVAAGVRREQVHVSGLCTQTHHEVFDSYRVQGPRAGRMIAAIRVPHV